MMAGKERFFVYKEHGSHNKDFSIWNNMDEAIKYAMTGDPTSATIIKGVAMTWSLVKVEESNPSIRVSLHP